MQEIRYKSSDGRKNEHAPTVKMQAENYSCKLQTQNVLGCPRCMLIVEIVMDNTPAENIVNPPGHLATQKRRL